MDVHTAKNSPDLPGQSGALDARPPPPRARGVSPPPPPPLRPLVSPVAVSLALAPLDAAYLEYDGNTGTSAATISSADRTGVAIQVLIFDNRRQRGRRSPRAYDRLLASLKWSATATLEPPPSKKRDEEYSQF